MVLRLHKCVFRNQNDSKNRLSKLNKWLYRADLTYLPKYDWTRRTYKYGKTTIGVKFARDTNIVVGVTINK